MALKGAEKIMTGFGGGIPPVLRILMLASALALVWILDAGGSLSLFLVQISIILAFSCALGAVARHLRQPSVLGEIIGGIILGPTVIGAVVPSIQSWLFPASGPSAQALRITAYLGLMAFLFIAGMEVGRTGIRHRRAATLVTSISGIVLPFALGFGMVILIPGIWHYPQGDMSIFAVFMGTALSISALPVIARMLIDLGILDNELGLMIVSAATIDDIVGWSLFSVILGSMNSGAGLWLNLVLTIGMFSVTAYMVHLEERHRSKLEALGGAIDLLVISMLAASVISESTGGHAIFGAFLSGVIFSHRRGISDIVIEKAYPAVIGILAPIYFTTVGLRVDFVASFDPAMVLVVFAVACFGKILGAGIGAKIAGVSSRESLALGFGLNARGAMEIALASAALSYGLIGQGVFVSLVIMAIATTAISGMVLPRLIGTRPLSRKVWEPTPLHELKGSYNYNES